MKEKKSMLDLCKIVLQRVSFNSNLFLKEYRKSLSWLAPMEVKELKNWIRENKLNRICTH
jgi:hypothetical protein